MDRREYNKKYLKEWREKNKDRIREYSKRPVVIKRQRIAYKKWYEKYKKTQKYISRNKAKARINKIFKKYNYICQGCGEEDINKLQVHHLTYSLDIRPEEACTLLCSECHKKRHL